MSEEKGSRKEIRTPMRMNLDTERAMSLPGMAKRLAPMAGGQNGEPQVCTDKFHQNICVEGEVTTTVTASCKADVFCLGGGIGGACVGRIQRPPAECTFKFFENLCVEVEVTISADAHCDITGIVCGPADDGPCPPIGNG